MKFLYQFVTAIVICALGFPFFAFGEMENDSVQMGAGYTNDIYYSMETGEVEAVNRTNWDIAFYTSTWSAGIIINEGNGVVLRLYPNADTSGWNSIDTTGLSTWPTMYNSSEMWEDGAFNRSALGHPDYGWGVYNTINHDVVGDSLYILTFVDGSAKKIWIERKIATQNIYMFKYADLDGSNEVSDTVNCTEYTAKNFLYYSLQTGEILDREPASDSWDLLFTKYIAMLEGNVPYPVTGVLQNEDVPANRYDEVAPDYNDWSAEPFDSTKVPIGYDWKYFDMGSFSYVVEDSIAFFVSNMKTDVYKLVFSAFDYTVGKFVFSKEMSSPAGIVKAEKVDQYRVFPNPAKDYVMLEVMSGINPDAVTVVDLTGRVVYKSTSVSELTRINLGSIPGGMYLVNLQAGNEVYVQKLLIQSN